jgi:Pentapeptide repeats (8 copies)/Lectin C-type domain
VQKIVDDMSDPIQQTENYGERVERWLDAQAETGRTINRLILTLLGLVLFSILTLGFPDSYLLTTTTTVNIPFAGAASFKTLLILGPIILITIRAYLEVYILHWSRLEATTDRFKLRRTPQISPLRHPLLRWTSRLILFGAVPLGTFVFAWEAMVFPAWGTTLLAIALATLFIQIFVLLPPESAGRNAVLPVIGSIVISSIILAGSQSEIRRPFELQLANLERSIIAGEDLKSADLTRAKLENADLSNSSLVGAILRNANLKDADLSNSDLSGASLQFADLSGANLRGATLHNANLRNATLRGSDLSGAKPAGANFSETLLDSAKVNVNQGYWKHTILRKTSFKNAPWRDEWLWPQYRNMMEYFGAIICDITQPDGSAYSGRCLFRWEVNKHFYQLVDRRLSWEEAIAQAKSARLTVEGNCLQGYLLTISSQKERDAVNSTFGLIGDEGYWIGATDESSEGTWRWIGGPEAGKIFWSGGAKGKGGKPVDEKYSAWHDGEPNNNTVADGNRNEEDFVGGLIGWNDVTDRSQIRAIIEYGGMPCIQ